MSDATPTDQFLAAQMRYVETHYRQVLFQTEADRLAAQLAEAQGIVEGCKRVTAALFEAWPILEETDPSAFGDNPDERNEP